MIRHTTRLGLLVALGSAVLSASAAAGFADDPLKTANDLPPTLDQRLADAGLPPCSNDAPVAALTLLDVVRRALCFNPQTRQAWSAIEAQTAALGVGRAAYLPTATLNAGVSRVNEKVKYPGMSELNSSLHGGSNEETLALNWVLYDFGLRAANLRRERALLDAVSASQDESTRAVFIDAARAYYTAVQTQATFTADLDAEQVARRSVDVVVAKVNAGVGSDADRLQATTAAAQTSLSRIRANEDLQKALGAVAVVMGIRPGSVLSVQAPRALPAEIPEVSAMADRLIDQAMRVHPKIAAAHAQLEAARDDITAIQAGGRPSISLAAIGDRSDNPVDRVSTEQTIESSSVGLQLNIPLFEGFGRTYRIRQAQAELQGREAAVFAAQQDVAQNVWDSYVSVRASTEDLKASEILLDNATQSFDLATGRYKSGVGSVIELLKAQSDLASAREYDAQSRTRWRLARLQLATSLGEVDLSSLADPAPAEPASFAPAQQQLRTAAPAAAPIGPAPAPRVSSILPRPVVGGRGPQALTINGEYFLDGATVQLHDRTHGIDYPDRVPILVEATSIWVWADIGCDAAWTAEVVNPDGRRSGERPFEVSGSCDTAARDAGMRAMPTPQ